MAVATLDDIMAELAMLRAQVGSVPVAAPTVVPTFAEFALQWLPRTRTRVSVNTFKAYEADLRCHLKSLFGDWPLDAIKVSDVDDAVARWAREGAAARTINRRLAVLASVLEYALEHEYVTRNVAAGRNRRLKQPVPQRSLLLRADHVEALLKCSSAVSPRGRDRALFATLMFAGLRIGEALALRWEHINLDRGTISIVAAKTVAGVRTIPMLPILLEELASFEVRSRPHHGDGGLVFGTKSNTMDFRIHVCKRMKKTVERANRLLRAAGLETIPPDPPLTPHSLRRTCASILFAIGQTPPQVMATLGHAHADMTLSAYARGIDPIEAERLRTLVAGAKASNHGAR